MSLGAVQTSFYADSVGTAADANLGFATEAVAVLAVALRHLFPRSIFSTVSRVVVFDDVPHRLALSASERITTAQSCCRPV